MFDIPTDEKVVVIVRRHWFVFLLQLISVFLLFFAPLILYLVLVWAVNQFGGESGLAALQINPALILAGTALWTLVIWYRLYAVWTNYYLDCWVVTNRRLISLDQVTFFNRHVSGFRLDRIQDITTHVEGLLETFLDYGDISVQTAGEEKLFYVRDVPSPAKLKELMMKGQDEEIRTYKMSMSDGLT